MPKSFSLIIILTEGIRGHLYQSRGVAAWLKYETGASVVEYEIPALKGSKRISKLKLAGSRLHLMRRRQLDRWISETGGGELFSKIAEAISANATVPEECLLISAGSDPARFTFALGRRLGIKTCVIMTPSLLGTELFDFAIVPGHDAPRKSSNLFQTLGAPNAINSKVLKEGTAELEKIFPRGGKSSNWAVLIGGDDANYRVRPEWAKERISKIIGLAEELDAGLYITTSRRTPPETEKVLSELVEGKPNVRMLLLASESDFNPVPGMLGLCSTVFCTEDSVSMLSEAATAGHVSLILRVGRKEGLRQQLQNYTQRLVDIGIISRARLWGVPRFDAMIESFKERELARELPSDVSLWRPELICRKTEKAEFNEAKRAAEWLLKGWK